MNNKELIVGVVFPAKKISHLRDILSETRDGVRFVLIDLSDKTTSSSVAELIKTYGHFDVLLHKLAHEMVFSRHGDKESEKRLKLMQDYIKQQNHLIVIDPLSSVGILTDREAVCKMLDNLAHEVLQEKVVSCVKFRGPKYHVVHSLREYQMLINALDEGKIQLPLICKAIDACATEESHMMQIITQRKELEYKEDLIKKSALLYQEFINHSGRLYKGYVLGEKIIVAERPSLPNLSLQGNTKAIHFNTQEKYPTHVDFYPDKDHMNEKNEKKDEEAAKLERENRLFPAVKQIGQFLCQHLKLTLFGFDVIVAEETQDLVVIDVNYFPSYKEIQDFDQVLRKHIQQQYTTRKI